MIKGSEFERQFCDRLSEWWTGEPGRRIFWRSSNSGGMATVRNKKGKRIKQHCGDVCAIDPIGFPLTDLITIELKRGYNRASIADLLDKPKYKNKPTPKQLYEKWIEQAEKAAEGAGTPYWLLVVRRDHREPIVFMPEMLANSLCGLLLDFTPYFILRTDSIDEPEICGTTLREFFRNVTPLKIKQRNEPEEKNAGQ